MHQENDVDDSPIFNMYTYDETLTFNKDMNAMSYAINLKSETIGIKEHSDTPLNRDKCGDIHNPRTNLTFS